MTTTTVRNPANGEVIDEVVPTIDREDVDRLVIKAGIVFRSGDWSDATVRERGIVLGRFAQLIRRDLEKLAHLESSNTGKPVFVSEI